MSAPIMRAQFPGVESLVRNLTALERQVLPQATARSLNRTIVTVRKGAVANTAKEMGTKQRTVRDATTLQKATKYNSQAGYTATGKPIPLTEFRATQRRKGVAAAPWNKRQLFAGTFLSTLAGPARAFVRTSSSRFPVRMLFGPGVPPTMAGDDVVDQAKADFDKLMQARLPREIDYYVARLLGRL